MNKVFSILLFTVLLTRCGIYDNLSPQHLMYSEYIDGYWGSWKYFEYESSSSTVINSIFHGSLNDFVVHSRVSHPSEFGIRVKVKYFDESQLSLDTWASFSGTIEYRHDGYSDIQSESKWFIQHRLYGLSLSSPSSVFNKIAKRNATIKIMKSKNSYTYNIYFDGVGIGLDVPKKFINK